MPNYVACIFLVPRFEVGILNVGKIGMMIPKSVLGAV